MPTSNTSENAELKKTLLSKADRCVKCGLCSAQCPTYLLHGSENESPRGRIALTQALASDQIDDVTSVDEHLKSCLTCLRCEKICPSAVNMTEILTDARALLQKNQPAKLESRIINRVSLISHRKWRRIAAITNLVRRTGIFSLVPKLKPVIPHIKPVKISSQNCQSRQNVYLFTGCISQILDSQTIRDAIDLLTLLGYSVRIPEGQVCCGTFTKHKGLKETSKQCQQLNQAAFGKSDDPIIFLASACGASLKSYEENFGNRALSINSFLNTSDLFAEQKFKFPKMRVLIHSPCSEKNVLGDQNSAIFLLQRFTELEVMTLKESTGCCGAAGDHMVSQATTANAVRERLIDAIEPLKPDVVVSSNYTCGIHIENGLREKNLDIAVMHPIRLLLKYIDSD